MSKSKSTEIRLDHRNYRKHGEENKRVIRKSLEELGAGRSIVIDAEGEIIAGNGVFEQAQELGIKTKIIETDGSELVVVKRTDLRTQDEKRKKLAVADNAASDMSEWADDLLREDWTQQALAEFGVELPESEIDKDRLIEQASSPEAVREYNDDTDYDLSRLYRKRVNAEIESNIEKAISDGKVRPEIADILRTRARQCSIFNFDEIIKYYRSKDATNEERELLRRLYLVFVAPKELFEGGVLKIVELSNQIYDDELMRAEEEAN